MDIARTLQVPNLFLVVNKVPSGVDFEDLREQMTVAYASETAAITRGRNKFVKLLLPLLVNRSAHYFMIHRQPIVIKEKSSGTRTGKLIGVITSSESNECHVKKVKG